MSEELQVKKIRAGKLFFYAFIFTLQQTQKAINV
jgi:hypothetical protein